MSLLDPRRARVIDNVAYGRDGWRHDTLFVSQSTDGEVELTTPLQIIKLSADQADELLDELGELHHRRVSAELKLAEY